MLQYKPVALYLCVYAEHCGKLCLHVSDSYVSPCINRLIAHRINDCHLK